MRKSCVVGQGVKTAGSLTCVLAVCAIVIPLEMNVAQAQTVRRADLKAPIEIGAVGAAPAPGSEERRALIERRRARITSHHRPIPVQESTVPFATDIHSDAFDPKARNRQAGFGTGVNVLAFLPVTESARKASKQDVKDYYKFSSPISEPSIAVRGDEILVTANWYAAMSIDGGKTFTPIDPYAGFGQPPVGDGFCCDQATIYDSSTDTMYWLMQGDRNKDGNSFRLLVATGPEQIRQQQWKVYDLPVTLVAELGKAWFDFPDIGMTDSHLFITTNVFTLPTPQKDSEWQAATIMRLPKSKLSIREPVTAETWTTSEGGPLRLAQGSRERMYFGYHRETAKIALRTWADSAAEVTPARTISVERWVPPSQAVLGNSMAKNNKPWLWRSDGRILAGWVTQEHVGFAWNAGEDDRFPRAHVRVAMIDRQAVDSDRSSDLPTQASAEPHIWAEDRAIAYPAAAVNSRGDVAMTVTFAGPKFMPSYAAGVLVRADDQEVPSRGPDNPAGPATGTDSWAWGFTSVFEGRNTPPCKETEPEQCGVWGDYFSLRPHGQYPATWVGVGYAMQDTQVTEVSRPESVYVWFEQKRSTTSGKKLAVSAQSSPVQADVSSGRRNSQPRQ